MCWREIGHILFVIVIDKIPYSTRKPFCVGYPTRTKFKQHVIHLPKANSRVGARVGHNGDKVTQKREVTRILGFALGPRGILDASMCVGLTQKSRIECLYQRKPLTRNPFAFW